MSVLSQQKIDRLKDLIIEEIKADFNQKYLSKNLVNTIRFEKTEDGYNIVIPAEVYNMYQYFTHGVIVSKGTGSYASSLDEMGSEFMVYPKNGKRFMSKPHNHIGYVERAIKNALQKWIQQEEDIKIKKN